jgi:hypothetical protein
MKKYIPRRREILRATLEEACLEKGEFFQPLSTLFCEMKRGFVDR